MQIWSVPLWPENIQWISWTSWINAKLVFFLFFFKISLLIWERERMHQQGEGQKERENLWVDSPPNGDPKIMTELKSRAYWATQVPPICNLIFIINQISINVKFRKVVNYLGARSEVQFWESTLELKLPGRGPCQPCSPPHFHHLALYKAPNIY